MFCKVNCTVFSKFASTATTYIVSLSNKKFKNPFPIFKTLGCITIALEPIESIACCWNRFGGFPCMWLMTPLQRSGRRKVFSNRGKWSKIASPAKLCSKDSSGKASPQSVCCTDVVLFLLKTLGGHLNKNLDQSLKMYIYCKVGDKIIACNGIISCLCFIGVVYT